MQTTTTQTAQTPAGQALLDNLLIKLHQARQSRDEWARYEEILSSVGPGRERALIAAGMSQVDADQLMNGREPASTTAHKVHRSWIRSVRKLERRIDGLKRWQERRAS